MARHDPAKIKMAELMLQGKNWEEAVLGAGVLSISRSAAYWFVDQYVLRGEEALEDRRQGRAYKVTAEVKAWLLGRCREAPEITSRELQSELCERYDLQVSIGHLNTVRAAHGVSRPKKKRV